MYFTVKVDKIRVQTATLQQIKPVVLQVSVMKAMRFVWMPLLLVHISNKFCFFTKITMSKNTSDHLVRYPLNFFA